MSASAEVLLCVCILNMHTQVGTKREILEKKKKNECVAQGGETPYHRKDGG